MAIWKETQLLHSHVSESKTHPDDKSTLERAAPPFRVHCDGTGAALRASELARRPPIGSAGDISEATLGNMSSSSLGRVSFPAPGNRSRDVRARITQLAAVVASTRMEKKRSVSLGNLDIPYIPRSSDEHVTEDAGAVGAAALEAKFSVVMARLDAVDVELLVRLEVAKVGNHTIGHGHRHSERVILTTEAVERVSWLFAMAAREFQSSAPDGDSKRARARGIVRMGLHRVP